MRFMMLMSPKEYDKAAPGTMPDPPSCCSHDEVQIRVAESRRASRHRWLASALDGSSGLVRGR